MCVCICVDIGPFCVCVCVCEYCTESCWGSPCTRRPHKAIKLTSSSCLSHICSHFCCREAPTGVEAQWMRALFDLIFYTYFKVLVKLELTCGMKHWRLKESTSSYGPLWWLRGRNDNDCSTVQTAFFTQDVWSSALGCIVDMYCMALKITLALFYYKNLMWICGFSFELFQRF